MQAPPHPNPFELPPAFFSLSPPLSLPQERGGCLMFSQLRLHAGSNHRLLPTAMLQRALRHAHPSNAFAGGVVRLEQTNISWVAN
eukprot:2980291-Pleurochrysis_carterae.AAC.1